MQYNFLKVINIKMENNSQALLNEIENIARFLRQNAAETRTIFQRIENGLDRLIANNELVCLVIKNCLK